MSDTGHLVDRETRIPDSANWLFDAVRLLSSLARLECQCARMERMDRAVGKRCFSCEAEALLNIVPELEAEHSAKVWPRTPVDCLLSELRDEFEFGGLTRERFEERVAQFKDEVDA